MKRKPLTHRQRGKLGGYTAARNMTPEERSLRASRAGSANAERHGSLGLTRAALGLKYKYLSEEAD